MKWTVDKPTVMGWYWYGDPRSFVVNIVRVVKSKSGIVQVKHSGFAYSLEEMDGRWAGPINQPEGKLPWED